MQVRDGMCGRYSLVFIDDLGNRFRVFNPMIGSRSRFNVPPGTDMPVIVRAEENELVTMRWGLVPHRSAVQVTGKPIINARAETLADKPLFRNLLKSQRCLVPATGFFEWKTEGHRKTPFYFSLKDSPCFAFAGLYDKWLDPSGKKTATYTIITTAPNELVARIHNRMPVILKREDEGRWLSEEPLTPARLTGILASYSFDEMAVFPVSTLVNDPAIDDERVIAPLNSLATDTYHAK
jgi:putative SOS response-associated peptidase YedK